MYIGIHTYTRRTYIYTTYYKQADKHTVYTESIHKQKNMDQVTVRTTIIKTDVPMYIHAMYQRKVYKHISIPGKKNKKLNCIRARITIMKPWYGHRVYIRLQYRNIHRKSALKSSERSIFLNLYLLKLSRRQGKMLTSFIMTTR